MVNKMNILAVKEIKVDFPYSSIVDERSPVCFSCKDIVPVVFEINQLVSSRLSRARSLRCNAFSVPDSPCPRSLRGRAFSVPNTLWPWSLRGYEFFVPNTPCPHSYTADTGTGLSSSW